MRLSALATVVVGLVSLVACKSEPAGEGEACTKKQDCGAGLSCLDNTCVRLDAEASAATPSGYCATVAAMAGAWTFDTTVVGAEDLASRGINGHYEMTVVVDNCAASINLVKTGYDAVKYSDKKIQTSEAALAESQQIAHAAEATVSLKGKPTHTMTFVVRDGQLFGHWQSTGDEWTRAGMWGFLRGVAQGQDLANVTDFTAQPCEVACLTQCDVVRRRADATLNEPALAACMTACGGEVPIVGCGAPEPLPEELLIAVSGPAKSLADLCTQAGAERLATDGIKPGAVELVCDRKPPVNGKPAARSLAKSALGGSFKAAQLVQIGYSDVGYAGHLVLALETEAGWFWTESLLDLSVSGVGGIDVSTSSLVLRPRELLAAVGREVVAEIAMKITDSDLALNEVATDTQKYIVVCATGSPPTCMRMISTYASQRTVIDDEGSNPKPHPNLRSERGELYLAFLPGDRLSISTPAAAPAADRELSGIYAWPG